MGVKYFQLVVIYEEIVHITYFLNLKLYQMAIKLRKIIWRITINLTSKAGQSKGAITMT
jgi:hypothetical protein